MPAAKCVICNAEWKKKNRVSLFQIPKNPWRRERWNKACNKDLTDSDKVCEKHFLKTDFIDPPGTSKKTRLLPCALPSVFFGKHDVKVTKPFLDI